MSLRRRAEEALRRAGAATPGPWEKWVSHGSIFQGPAIQNTSGRVRRPSGTVEICECNEDDFDPTEPPEEEEPEEWLGRTPVQTHRNAEFISAARADVPDFAAALLRMTAPEMRERIRAKLIDTVEPAANSAAFVVFGAGPDVCGRFADAIMGLLLAEVA